MVNLEALGLILPILLETMKNLSFFFFFQNCKFNCFFPFSPFQMYKNNMLEDCLCVFVLSTSYVRTRRKNRGHTLYFSCLILIFRCMDVEGFRELIGNPHPLFLGDILHHLWIGQCCWKDRATHLFFEKSSCKYGGELRGPCVDAFSPNWHAFIKFIC